MNSHTLIIYLAKNSAIAQSLEINNSSLNFKSPLPFKSATQLFSSVTHPKIVKAFQSTCFLLQKKINFQMEHSFRTRTVFKIKQWLPFTWPDWWLKDCARKQSGRKALSRRVRKENWVVKHCLVNKYLFTQNRNTTFEKKQVQLQEVASVLPFTASSMSVEFLSDRRTSIVAVLSRTSAFTSFAKI